jgi:plasmid stability protein
MTPALFRAPHDTLPSTRHCEGTQYNGDIDNRRAGCYKQKSTMIHKQISLPEELARQIRERAKTSQESEEQVIRQLLEQGLVSTRPWRNAGEALRSLGDLGIKGPKDLAQKHDEYLAQEK